MWALWIFPSFLCGGIVGRLRGEDLGVGDWFNRFVLWGMLVGIRVGIATHNVYYGAASIVLAGLGASLGYYGQFDLNVPANRTLNNYIRLSLTGMFRFFPLFIAACVCGLGWRTLPAVLAGIFFVPSYLLGLWLAPRWTFTASILEVTSATEWGEFIFWGLIYTTLVVGLTWT